MPVAVRRGAVALGSGALLALGLAGCSQPGPSNDSSKGAASASVDLKIVEQVQVDLDGREVEPEAGATPADPAGNGKAICAPVTIAMAGALGLGQTDPVVGAVGRPS